VDEHGPMNEIYR